MHICALTVRSLSVCLFLISSFFCLFIRVDPSSKAFYQLSQSSVKFPSSQTNVFQLEPQPTCAHKNIVKVHRYCRKQDGAERKQQSVVVAWLRGCSLVICMHFLCTCCPSAFTSLSNAKAPCLAPSPLLYALHVFTVSLGHCSARLPQSIGHGWLANRSYTLKWQNILVTRDMFTGCQGVYAPALHLLTLRTFLPRSG